MGKQFRGKTEDADAVFLAADFWKGGVTITGKVIRTFDSENGRCYVLQLATPVKVGVDEVDEATIGNLTGIRMALQACGLDRLIVGDEVYLECTGFKATPKGNRANFEIEVNRP